MASRVTSSHRSRFKITQGVLQENVIRKVAPEYPEEARAKQIQGHVSVGITVDKNGDVTEARLVDGDPALGKAALKAIEQWNSALTS